MWEDKIQFILTAKNQMAMRGKLLELYHGCRERFASRKFPPRSIPNKWHGILPLDLKA
jgi:hypothetical protein